MAPPSSVAFGAVTFALLVGGLVVLDWLAQHEPTLLEPYGLDILDLIERETFVLAVRAAALVGLTCGATHAAARSRSSEGYGLMLMLLLGQAGSLVANILYVDNALYDRDAVSRRRRTLTWASTHLTAGVLAIALALVRRCASVLVKVLRWRRALRGVASSAAGYAGGGEAAAEGGGGGAAAVSAPRTLLVCYANVGSGHRMAARAIEAAIGERKAQRPER